MKTTALLTFLLVSTPSVSFARVMSPVALLAPPALERTQPKAVYQAPQLIALSRKKIEARFASDAVLSLEITRGIGILINFAPLGDSISGVQISDPSTLVYKQMGAGAVFIKPIGKLNFEGNLSAASGRNLLTIVMNSGAIYQMDLSIKTHTVAFSGIDIVPDGTLSPAPLPPAAPSIPTTTAAAPTSNNGAPAPLVAELETPSEQIPQVSFFDSDSKSAPESQTEESPSVVEPEIVAKVQPPEASETSKPQKVKKSKKNKEKAKETPVEDIPVASKVDASAEEVLPSRVQPEVALKSSTSEPQTPAELSHAIARGLPVAVNKKQISRGSYTYYKSQSAIRFLRRGRAKTLEQAARMSRTKLSVLTQLVKWGTNQ
jgi:hypothetical protein